MRLWHTELLPVLPHQQLVSQWRECCCIAANLANHGTPNHMLVNKILNYSYHHFETYCIMVMSEMRDRGYNISADAYNSCTNNIEIAKNNNVFNKNDMSHSLFQGWFNDRYLLQCICNLQEKYDCGGIPQDEWDKVIPIIRSLFKRLDEDNIIK